MPGSRFCQIPIDPKRHAAQPRLETERLEVENDEDGEEVLEGGFLVRRQARSR